MGVIFFLKMIWQGFVYSRLRYGGLRMKTIVIDEDKSVIEEIRFTANDIGELDIVGTFYDGEAALRYIENNALDLVILDVSIHGVDSSSLGREIKKKIPDVALVYTTGDLAFPIDAINLRAVAYLQKPCTAEALKYAVDMAALLSKKKKKKVFARTFGYFDLFVSGKPIMFKSAKAKELLALLIDRQGGTVTSDQIIGTLWEDRPNDVSTQNLCSKICKTLEKELRDNGAGDMLVSSRSVKCLDTDQFECDLYMMLDGDKKTADRYIGEYMMEYSWAENKAALLDKYLQNY